MLRSEREWERGVEGMRSSQTPHLLFASGGACQPCLVLETTRPRPYNEPSRFDAATRRSCTVLGISWLTDKGGIPRGYPWSDRIFTACTWMCMELLITLMRAIEFPIIVSLPFLSFFFLFVTQYLCSRIFGFNLPWVLFLRACRSMCRLGLIKLFVWNAKVSWWIKSI